jgi:uroporphyrinogen-III synthase
MAKPLANIGVAITRPLHQSQTLTALIENAGGHVISYPLLEIIPWQDNPECYAAIQHLENIHWAIFISSNAVLHGMPIISKHSIPPLLKFAAIGPSTAQALNKFGVKDVLTPENQYDSESLLSMPELQQVQGSNILIVRGKGGRELLREALIKRGANVTYAECYQRINPQIDCEVLDKAWAQNRFQAIIVSSTEAMRHLIALAKNKPWISQVHLFTHHPRIAEHAAGYFKAITISAGPSDQEILNSLFQQRLA